MPLTLLLHGRHGSPAVMYEPLGPWLVPWQFGPKDEYGALRRGVGLVDYSTQALIECRGADRADFLQRLLTNDIASLAPGTGGRTALLTPTAKLLAECLVLAEADAHWLFADLPRAELAARALERYHFTEQITMTFHERRQGVLALEGPRTMELLAELTEAPLALQRLGDHASIVLEGTPVRLIRRSLTGGVGVWCVVDAASLEGLWTVLVERGGPFGLTPVGWQALNAARLEAGEPWPGLDWDETILLPETGLESVLASGTKGCYVGQEIVARMQTYGSPSKRLMGLVFAEAATPSPGDRIVKDGAEAGALTSSCHSPALGRPIAMGYLKRGVCEPGTSVEVVHGDARLSATVSRLPFISPKSVDRSP